ncbi:MAG: tRNA pseudouridine(55) synthase TruB [Verrucomicrobia bacterium]|nr:tRNA pseudouridine(55) synthase TruB [Verrucomicrobiota bacterium]MCF7709094.1 tRNA pseudouridine(55) synthase TruB [Verrucomicrobiota bacterium]
MQQQSEFNSDGAILVDKPTGPTSHDVVAAIRRRFRIKKVGHCGTLDPNATGLLVVVVGRGTKLSNKIIASDKAYEGVIKFGEITNTHDATGEILSSHPVPELTIESLNETAAGFIGDQMQMPPMHSAIKQNGVPLYKLARKGKEVERKSRLIHIYRFHFTDYTPPFGGFEVTCTKGTYVRTLVHELGEIIGCGAHLHDLRRTMSGRFKIENAVEFNRLLEMPLHEFQKHVLPVSVIPEYAEAPLDP